MLPFFKSRAGKHFVQGQTVNIVGFLYYIFFVFTILNPIYNLFLVLRQDKNCLWAKFSLRTIFSDCKIGDILKLKRN